MIIFNLWAIPVGLVIAGVSALLFKVAPELLGGVHEKLIVSVVAVVVAGFAEFVGVKARLFFLPVWLLGAGIGAYQAWGLWGAAGLAIGGGVVAALIIAFVLTIVWSARNATKEIPERLIEAREAFAAGKLEDARNALADAWVLPFFTRLSLEHAQALLPVVAMVEEERSRLGVDPMWTKTLAESRRLLQSIGTEGPYGFFSDQQLIIGAIEPWLRDPKTTPSVELVKALNPDPTHAVR